MNTEYKSIETIVFKSLNDKVLTPAVKSVSKNVSNFEYAVKINYGSLAAPFRISTTIRKFSECQTFFDTTPKPFHPSKLFGFITGMFGSMASYTFLIYCFKNEVSKGNYVPLITAGTIFTATNLASLFYELGRKSNSLKQKNGLIN